jgi:signal transduction histidine kinase
LRTPLNSIVGFSDLLRSVDNPDDRKQFIQIIRTHCDILLRLINDILEASEMSDAQMQILPRKIDFAKEFDNLCQSLEQRVDNPKVTFIKDNPYTTLPIIADMGRMQQVLTNFVTNAVKNTTEGHIKVGYRLKDERYLYVYCEDTGSGIPKEKQDAIFERFVKLNEFVQGTGLGLSICKNIIMRCGGKIGVDSEEGKGATFWFSIPVQLNTNN